LVFLGTEITVFFFANFELNEIKLHNLQQKLYQIEVTGYYKGYYFRASFCHQQREGKLSIQPHYSGR
jgi:hypothetical protein